MIRFDSIGKDTLSRLEDMINISKFNDLVKKEEEKKNTLIWILAIIGAIVAVAGIAYAVYKFLNPDYLDDFEDDFDDDFEDDYFEEDVEETVLN